MGETGEQNKKKTAARVILALVTFGAAGCKPVELKSGDLGTIVRQTNCWQYPGAENASRLEAPLGQEDHGLIREGARAMVSADEETETFGATSNLGTWIRVEVNGQEITPSKGVIANLATEQGISDTSVTESKNQACWIRSTDFSPTNK